MFVGSDDYYYGLNYDGWGDYAGDWYATAWDDYVSYYSVCAA